MTFLRDLNSKRLFYHRLGDDWKDKTYEEFEVLRVSLLRQRAFFQSSLHLCGVLTGSILVALTIPDSSIEIIEHLNIIRKFLGLSRG